MRSKGSDTLCRSFTVRYGVRLVDRLGVPQRPRDRVSNLFCPQVNHASDKSLSHHRHSSATGPLADISSLAENLQNAGRAHFEMAAVPKSGRSGDLLVLAMTIISEVS